jgi:phosphate starvation-inducible PhoH-like protein
MIDDQIVEIAPLAYMRGRTFKQAWIIADEMQNATPAQIKMLLTRIGEGSKIVVTGDVDQTDRAKRDNGLLDLVTRLQAQPVNGLEVCSLNVKDVQRHPLIGPVLKLYQDLK